jgi:ABC-type transport system involved in multi-copper enzyme maturation permease subunit
MSSASHPSKVEQTLPAPQRRETVVMGRSDFLSVVLRLIGVELYKMRRRSMSKVLGISGTLLMILIFLGFGSISLFYVSSPASSFLPPPCTPNNTVSGPSCLDHTPTQTDMAQAEAARHAVIQSASSSLRLPLSLVLTSSMLQGVGLILIIILAGTIGGGEYNVGTVRLMFTRGPTRGQFYFAKIGAVFVFILFIIAWGELAGIGTGAVLNLFTGISTTFSFFTPTWMLHTFLYLLVVALGMFMYAMIALTLSSLGKATAAGVAGSMIWWVLEFVLRQASQTFGTQTTGGISAFWKAVPDYLISPNIDALAQNQTQYLGGQPGQLSDLHAILVLTVYLVLLIGLTWWATQYRDVTA